MGIVSFEIVLYITSILVWLYMVIVCRSVHSEYDCGEFRVNIDSSAVGRTLYPGQLFSQGSSACFKTSRLYNNDFQSPVSRFNDNKFENDLTILYFMFCVSPKLRLLNCLEFIN